MSGPTGSTSYGGGYPQGPGGYQPGPGGYQQPEPGGYQPQPGGYQPGQGGYPTDAAPPSYSPPPSAPTSSSTSASTSSSSGGTSDARPSVGELLSDISRDITTLMRQEVELAKAEAKQTATKAGTGVGMLGGAGIAAHFVLLFLSLWLWWALSWHTGIAKGALIVAALWAIIAGVLVVLGRAQLQKAKGLPQTAASVKQIPNAVRGNEDSA